MYHSVTQPLGMFGLTMAEKSRSELRSSAPIIMLPKNEGTWQGCWRQGLDRQTLQWPEHHRGDPQAGVSLTSKGRPVVPGTTWSTFFMSRPFTASSQAELHVTSR